MESRPGVGTTFHVYLPAAERDTQAGEEEREKDKKQGVAAISERILLMDDEETVRNTGRRLLEHLGYSVALAENGSEAIAQYREARDAGRPFAAVILDLTVPGGMGGREAIKKLRELDGGVRAIVSSGYYDDPIMADFQEHGFCGIVAKPYKMEELGKALQAVTT